MCFLFLSLRLSCWKAMIEIVSNDHKFCEFLFFVATRKSHLNPYWDFRVQPFAISRHCTAAHCSISTFLASSFCELKYDEHSQISMMDYNCEFVWEDSNLLLPVVSIRNVAHHFISFGDLSLWNEWVLVFDIFL